MLPLNTAIDQGFVKKQYFHLKSQNINAISLEELKMLVRPRLKIVIVTETWPPEVNGVALSLLQLCRGLQKQGHKLLIIRPSQNESRLEFTPYKQVLVKGIKIPKYQQLQFGWPQIRKVSEEIKIFNPDVVHIVTEGPLGLAALKIAKSFDISVSTAFHSHFQDFSRFFDLAFLLKPIQNYLTWFHNQGQMTCIPSQEVKNVLLNLGVQSELVVIHHGVDTARFSSTFYTESLRERWKVTADTRVILFVGRLSPEKEIDVIIHAYSAMQKSQKYPTKLVIVGDGPDRKRLEDLCNGLDVVFTGLLSGQKLAQVYASADVFAFSSRVETFGNVVLEAMASGLPVIAYDAASAHLYVKHDVTGCLIPMKDTAGFIRAIQQIPERHKLNEMGQQARGAVEHLGWEYPVKQFESALYGICRQVQMIA